MLVFIFIISFITMSPSSFASPTGGWTEGEGYWSSDTNDNEGISIMAAAKPQSHTAKREYSGHNLRIVANTKWSGQRHYTRARYETYWGSVESDSGRVWGTNTTVAKSGWNDGELNRAKSYYGR